MLLKGWVTAEWGRLRYRKARASLQAHARRRKQLGAEIADFDRVMKAVYKVIET